MNAALAAARMTDPIQHSKSMKGFLLGALVGLAAGAFAVAMAAAVVATGGAALILVAAVGGAVAATGGGALAGAAIGGLFGKITGTIVTGASTVFINGQPAARAGADDVACSKHNKKTQKISQGSSSVFIENCPAARKSDPISCKATIAEGSPNVFIGANVNPPPSEVPAWMLSTAKWMTIIGGSVALGAGAAGGLCALFQFGGTVVFGMATGAGGSYVGGKIGYALGGERGKVIGEISGGFIGGIIGARFGNRLFSGHPIDVATGELMTEATDFSLPGPIPLVWQRLWLSSSTHHGELGQAWHHSYDMSLVKLPAERGTTWPRA